MSNNSLCYLVIISRNKWSDYRLATDLPSFLDAGNIGLKRNLRSLFPLDEVGNEIAVSRNLVSHDIFLQAWTGRLDCFELEDIPYTSEQGRPIKLGVGVLQKLSSSGQYESYELSHLGEVICKVVRDFQLFKEYSPIVVELSALGISGHPTFHELKATVSSSSRGINDISKEQFIAHTADVKCNRSNYTADSPEDSALSVRTLGSNVYSEDAEFLMDQSKVLFAGLLSSSICYNSPKLRKWALMAMKNIESLSDARYGDSLQDIYKCLRSIWRLEGPKVFGLEVKFLDHWKAPTRPISDHQIKLLKLQVTGILEVTSGTRSSHELVLRKLEQLQDTIRQIVSDVLG